MLFVILKTRRRRCYIEEETATFLPALRIIVSTRIKSRYKLQFIGHFNQIIKKKQKTKKYLIKVARATIIIVGCI